MEILAAVLVVSVGDLVGVGVGMCVWWLGCDGVLVSVSCGTGGLGILVGGLGCGVLKCMTSIALGSCVLIVLAGVGGVSVCVS